jgi:hypothetical protein
MAIQKQEKVPEPKENKTQLAYQLWKKDPTGAYLQ